MKLETFFEKFELFADAPDGVAKIRKLMLELGVSGKLSDSTKSWTDAPLGEVSKLRRGYDLPTQNRRPGSFPIFAANGPVGVHETGMVEGPGVVTGRSGSIGKVHFVDGDFWPLNTALYVEDFFGNDPQFICLLLRSLNLERFSTATAVPTLNRNVVHRTMVRVPPLAEQKRIVTKVDELIALCDRLEAQQQDRKTRHAALARASLTRFTDAPTPANLDLLFHKSYSISPADLRKSILTLAVQGKLIRQNPDDEPAAELLENIAKQRDRLLGSDLLRKSKPCRQFASDEAPHDIPETWTWTMLGEITEIGTGSTPSRTEASFWTDGTVPWITSGSTSRSPIAEANEFVTPAAVKAHRLRVYPPGTLLVALYGQGKTRGQVALLEIPATINQACAAVCPLAGIPSMQGYLKLLLEKQYDEMRSLSAGGAQPNLNVQKIKEVFVPLPPLAEQRRIVAKVGELMALVDALEAQLANARSAGAQLAEAVVAELVKGRALA